MEKYCCQLYKHAKLMMHTRKYTTELLTSQLALVMNTVTTRGMKHMKRRMYCRTKFNVFVTMEGSGNR